MPEGITVDRIRWRYGLNGIPERTLTAYVALDNGSNYGLLPVGNGEVNPGYDPTDVSVIDTIEDFANWIAYGMNPLLDGNVNISGITIERMSDPQTVIGVIPCALEPLSPASLVTAGVNGQFAGFRGNTVAGTISRRNIFGVSGLLNGIGDAIVANTGAPAGSPAFRLGDFLNRFNGNGIPHPPLQHFAVTRVEDTDLQFTPIAGNFQALVNHNVNHRARKRYTY